MINIQSVIEQNRDGATIGLPCFCTANEMVLRTLFECCATHDVPAVIEASSNQVNQDGGYTGMSAADFSQWIGLLSAEYGVANERLVMSGAHLGPRPWSHLSPKDALDKTKNLVKDFAAAGFRKIHLDAPVACNEEQQPDLQTLATRTARLCEIAEKHSPHPDQLVYVLTAPMTEPAFESNFSTEAHRAPPATNAEQLNTTLAAYQEAFIKQGLRHAWTKVVSIDAYLGIGFDHFSVHPLRENPIRRLSTEIMKHDGLSLSATSVDYQSSRNLSTLVENHVVFLKTGPELTFRMRESIFALATIAQQIAVTDTPDIIAVIDSAIIEHPADWAPYFTGDIAIRKQLHHYSFSDRLRYYWNFPDVRSQLLKFISSLDTIKLPEALVSQHFLAKEFGTLDIPASQLIHGNVKQSIYRLYQASGYHLST